MDALQQIIHRLEVGGGLRYLRIGLIAAGVLVLVGAYNWRGFKNMGTMEAMDSAQVARNIRQGKGFTTLFVRPLSIHLIQKQAEKKRGSAPPDPMADVAQLRISTADTKEANPDPASPDKNSRKYGHPDIANPPLYPVFLAGLMYILPFEWKIPDQPAPFWSMNGAFARYQPDFLITLVNQTLFLAVVAMVFLLAQRLFDKNVARLSALLLLGTELLWRFSASGLSTMLLLLIFTCLLWCLVALDEESREARFGRSGVFLLTAFAGLLVGAGALTRYAFSWLFLPVLFYVVLLAGRRQRFVLGAVAFLAFAVVVAPWLYRNYQVSGTLLGTATYSLAESSGYFPNYDMQRSLNPDFTKVDVLALFKDKLLSGVRRLATNDLPRLGGSWMSAFFLVGLLVGYPHPGVRRLRWFLVACLILLALVQGTAYSKLSEDSPEVNSENLLVLLVPMVIVFGTSLFYLLLDQVDWPFREMRYVALGLFAALVSLPMLLTVLPLGRSSPLSYPPYYPPTIQEITKFVREDELTMSDMPWAMAWYGQRQSAWLTINSQDDFYTINDSMKSVQMLYLTPISTDSRFLTQHWAMGFDNNWQNFMLMCYLRVLKQQMDGHPLVQDRELGPPKGFPLPLWHPQVINPEGNAITRWPETFLLTARFRPVPKALELPGLFPLPKSPFAQ